MVTQHNMTDAFTAIGFSMIVMGATATGELIENQRISLPTVASVGAIVAVGAWRLSSKFQKIDDDIETLDKKVSTLYCQREANCKDK